MKRAKATPVEILDDARIDQIAQSVRHAGAVALSKLTREKLSENARNQLMQGLLRRGLEPTKKAVRVSVEEQILKTLSGGARIQLRGFGRRIKGAVKAEIDGVLRGLIAAGKVFIVVRMKTEVLVSEGEQTLYAEELKALGKVTDLLGKVLKKVNAKGHNRTVLREDFSALIEPIALLLQANKKTKELGAEEFVRALKRFEHPTLKLIRVSEFVRDLEQSMSRDQIHRLLRQLAERGVIELQPELPGEFLSQSDAELCPPGSRGTFFSYARFLSPGANQ